MKKALLVALCLIAVGCVAVNGTFASDQFQAITKAVTDVFATLSNLLGDDNGTPTTGDRVDVSLSISPKNDNELLYPGKSAGTVTTVENKGLQSVYFRLVYAVRYDKSKWDNKSFEANALFNVTIASDATNSSDYIVKSWGEAPNSSEWKEIEINGDPYVMQVLTYTQALDAPSGGTTSVSAPAVTATVSFDHATTDEQFELYRDGNFMKTQVLAIETASFEKLSIGEGANRAIFALDNALPLNDSFNPF